MDLKEIFLLEIEGISKTICDYTTDNFITSYARKLEGLHYPDDRDQIQLISYRLKDWYDIHLPELKSNKFIHNMEAHLKSYELINYILDKI